MQNNTLELTQQEKQRLIKILHNRYRASINLFEIAEIKNMLIKLGEEVQDWTPSPEYLKS